MKLFTAFAMTLSPAIIGPDFPNRAEMIKNIRDSSSATPREFFQTFEEDWTALPKFMREKSDDLQDIDHFYHLTFSELREGKRKSSRIFRIPD